MRYKFLRFPEGKIKAVTFSYDDGCRQDIRLSNLFSKHGLKGTFNINSDFISDGNDDRHLSEKEIKENILDKGHEIAIHGAKHSANGAAFTKDGIQDVLNCRLSLEKRFGMIIRGMAYPDSGVSSFHNGTTYEMVKNYLEYLNIAYARALCGTARNFELPTDWHKWLPTAHHNDPKIFDTIDTFIKTDYEGRYISSCCPMLLYIWGHSYEFDNNDNWDRIEKICETVSGHDEIWYATNIEIYDYIKAFQSLVFSMDDSLVYNPTLKTIWFFGDGKTYKIEPGETLKLN